MRILEIALTPPGFNSGGALGVYQSVYSLSKIGKVDYIGVDYDENLFEDNVTKLYILASDKSKVFRIYNFIFKNISTGFYNGWKKIEKDIQWEKYDIIHIEYTRYEFLVKSIQRKNKKVMVRVHNIERDYAYNIFKNNKNLINYLRYLSFKTNEKKVMKQADGLVFLTRTDVVRAKNKYDIMKSKIFLNPMCIKKNIVNKLPMSSKISVLITGSLNYTPNEKGIIWFIKKVWKRILKIKGQKDICLIIAGSNPHKKLKKMIESTKNVQLIDTPDEMSVYFELADLYIAPIFDGAGMKVKVGEALSYGIPVVGTSCALVGYENICEYTIKANDEEEFAKIILKSEKLIWEKREKIKLCFDERLSLDKSVKNYKNILKEQML